MKKERKKEWRVVFLHNDFPDGTRSHHSYGKEGPICKRVSKNISPLASLKWHFHGGYINPKRSTLLRRLYQADVLISAYPWNMDMNDDNMHWLEAENSLLSLLKEIKKENKKLKIFFLLEPQHLADEFEKIGEIISDIHEHVLYDYFLKR